MAQPEVILCLVMNGAMIQTRLQIVYPTKGAKDQSCKGYVYAYI